MKTLSYLPITAKNADNKDLRNLYETAFPVEEQIPYDDLRQLLSVMPLDFKAYYDGETFVGLTIVLKRDDYDWFWYFAVSADLRGKGYGQQILSALKSHYTDHSLIIDIESPEQICDNIEQRRRRYGFYLRNGFRDTHTAKSFEGIDYTILISGDGVFSQTDYDNLIGELRAFWRNMPTEQSE